MIRRRKEYSVAWRHRRLDTPGYPFRGSGLCWGVTKRKALDGFFTRRFVQGDTTGLVEMERAYRAGEIEILRMEVSP